MRINILKEGDQVLSVTQNYIAVKRANSEVDLVPMIDDPTFGLRVDTDKIITIGYGDNEVSIACAYNPFIDLQKRIIV